jgi:endoglucanase
VKQMSAALLLLALLASAVCAAPERTTPMIVKPEGNVLANSYAYVANGGAVESESGHLPLVDYGGRRAAKLHVTGPPGGSFGVGIPYGSWVKFYVADYVPEGALEFEFAGRPGAGTTMGIVDTDNDGDGPDTAVVAAVSLAHYVGDAEGWHHVAIPIADFVAAAPGIDLDNLEKIVFDGPASPEFTFYLADVVFRTTHPARTYAPVKVDQVGYPVGWRKLAKVTPAAPLPDGAAFVVEDAQSGKAAFQGTLKVAVLNDASSGDNVYDADFTPLDTPGGYVVDVPGIGRSAPFRIGADVYGQVFYDVSRFWFFQRCGMELEPKYAGADAHRACHVFDEAIPDPRGGMRDCRGGWHDAGDMNRYTPWTIQPIFMLLTLYRHHPDAFSDSQMNIPESGNGVPDLLDETKCELQWVRKMLIRKGPDAGMVYDRVNESYVKEQPPGVDFFDRRHGLSGTTDEAACALVADLAHASLVYRDFPQERQFAADCLDDALLAWKYLTTRGKPDDEHMFTAAALLFEATGRQDANDVVKRLSEKIISTWSGHIIYGVYDGGLATYALSERPEVDKALQARLRDYYKGFADATVQAARSKGYSTPMFEGIVFSWGSNGLISKAATHLLMVNRFAPDQQYVAVARETLHWLLGRNPVDVCMATGHGTPPLGPIYHSMFGPLGPGLPMPPGYLPGGPSVANCPGISNAPAKAWRPDWTNWVLTEPALGYQGPLTYLLGSLTAGEGR